MQTQTVRRSRQAPNVPATRAQQGIGTETDRVWPPRRTTSANPAMFSKVKKVVDSKQRRTRIFIESYEFDLVCAVEHYEYWGIPESRRAMKGFFNENAQEKRRMERLNLGFVLEAYRNPSESQRE